jgi:hypothetical protein
MDGVTTTPVGKRGINSQACTRASLYVCVPHEPAALLDIDHVCACEFVVPSLLLGIERDPDHT